MDAQGTDFIHLWKCFDKNEVRYIIVDDLAVSLHGFNHFSGVISLWIDDSINNRKRASSALKEYGIDKIEIIKDRTQSLDLIDFTINDGLIINLITSLKGLEQYTFDDCLQSASIAEIENVSIPFLHINHLIANKKAVNRPKDQLDVIYLEKIKKLREEENL